MRQDSDMPLSGSAESETKRLALAMEELSICAAGSQAISYVCLQAHRR